MVKSGKERGVDMKVGNMEKAWEEANKIFPYDYEKDEEGSLKAGYSIYRSTAGEHPQNWISDLGDRLEINLENGTSMNIWIEEQGEDVEVTVIAKTGETRTYKTYAEYRKEFRFFWSSGQESKYEDGVEVHFEKIIQALRMVNEDDAKLESHRNGLTSVFTLKKWR